MMHCCEQEGNFFLVIGYEVKEAPCRLLRVGCDAGQGVARCINSHLLGVGCVYMVFVWW